MSDIVLPGQSTPSGLVLPTGEPIKNSTTRASELADRLGVHIPGEIEIWFWMLPLLESLADRLERLEARHGAE